MKYTVLKIENEPITIYGESTGVGASGKYVIDLDAKPLKVSNAEGSAGFNIMDSDGAPFLIVELIPSDTNILLNVTLINNNLTTTIIENEPLEKKMIKHIHVEMDMDNGSLYVKITYGDNTYYEKTVLFTPFSQQLEPYAYEFWGVWLFNSFSISNSTTGYSFSINGYQDLIDAGVPETMVSQVDDIEYWFDPPYFYVKITDDLYNILNDNMYGLDISIVVNTVFITHGGSTNGYSFSDLGGEIVDNQTARFKLPVGHITVNSVAPVLPSGTGLSYPDEPSGSILYTVDTPVLVDVSVDSPNRKIIVDIDCSDYVSGGFVLRIYKNTPDGSVEIASDDIVCPSSMAKEYSIPEDIYRDPEIVVEAYDPDEDTVFDSLSTTYEVVEQPTSIRSKLLEITNSIINAITSIAVSIASKISEYGVQIGEIVVASLILGITIKGISRIITPRVIG